ncbi:MAG: DUF4912 domain-containing protein [Spirochaetaceae bacterium]|nr:DUF4912 domain-containing protein [Spirochaetaceae bacterium]
MDTADLSLSYLQTLSSSDLLALADELGIDIPDDLDRNFVIGELLDAASEILADSKEDIHLLSGKAKSSALPETYNVTMIDVVLRNPVWAFVYWDLKKSDVEYLKENNATLMLRVSFFDSELESAVESFDMGIKLSDRKQYILIPTGKSLMRIDLLMESSVETLLIAQTRFVSLPHGCTELTDVQPGKQTDIPEIMNVSGMERLLKEHYVNHRQSFS